jgi:zinc/manganese transport system permease protein
VGYFGACVLAALAIGLLPPTVGGSGRSEESAVIGTVQAFLLAAGFLFVSLYRGFLGGIDALLFGSFLGISAGRVVVVAAVSVGCLLALGLIGRPLLFASVDPGVAAARGIPVRLLSALMLLVLGLAAAEISQITGALLVFALLVMPAAAAQQLTARPGPGLALAAGLGVAIVWLSLVIAYYAPYPVGFFTTSVGLVVYLLSLLLRRVRDSRLVAR